MPFTDPFESKLETRDPSQQATNVWRSTEFTLAPGAACDPCNSSWMDRVDREAERVVEPMVLGRKATIRKLEDQRAVARWVSQVAILLDRTQNDPVIPAEIPQTYFSNREPINGSVIWLARTEPEWTLDSWFRSWIVDGPFDPPPRPTNRPNMCLVTFRILNLVVQSVIPLNDSVRDVVAFRRGENMKFLRVLWPTRYPPISWPPASIIPANSLETFARSFEPPDIPTVF
jgi:hypothetical protein